MQQTTDFTLKLSQKINNSHILFFDLDGTLVDTDYANFLAYKKAILDTLKNDYNILYNHNLH